MPSVGSAIENTTVQPPLWRENIAIGALTEFVLRLELLHRRQGRQLWQRFGGLRRRLGLDFRKAVQEHVVDHLVEIDRDLLVADGLRQFADQAPRALRDLNEVRAGLRDLLGEGAREHRIGIGVVIGEPVERGLPRPGREDREHAFRQLRHRRKTAAAGNRTRAGAFERIIAAGIEHQDGGAHLPVLQPLDDAVGEDRGVAHQLFLALGRCRHVGRQQEILAGDFKAVAGEEKERGVAGIDRLVEGQQRLAERLPVLVFRHHHREAEAA